MARRRFVKQALDQLLNASSGLTTAELNTLDGVTATTAELNKLAGVTATTAELNTLDDGTAVKKFTQTVGYAAFTDGGAAVGTYTLTATNMPVGASILRVLCTALTGFAGDTSATIVIGDGTDTDRYMTGTPSVFTTAAAGIDLGLPSGVAYHAAAKDIILTVTSAADFTSVNAGSITLEVYYLT